MRYLFVVFSMLFVSVSVYSEEPELKMSPILEVVKIWNNNIGEHDTRLHIFLVQRCSAVNYAIAYASNKLSKANAEKAALSNANDFDNFLSKFIAESYPSDMASKKKKYEHFRNIMTRSYLNNIFNESESSDNQSSAVDLIDQDFDLCSQFLKRLKDEGH